MDAYMSPGDASVTHARVEKGLVVDFPAEGK